MRRRRKPGQDQEGSLKASAQHESSPSRETLSVEPETERMQQAPAESRQKEAGQEESSVHSVRSRRRKPYKRPRQQQHEQAPDASGAHMPMKAATPAPTQAPNPEGSQMPQHAHKRARAEPTQGPESSTGGETLQEALAPRALRPVQNFTAIGTQTPPKASTPTARDISRDMASATAPLHVTATAHQTQTPQLAHLQQPISLSTPDLATPPMPIPQAARGDTYFGTPFPGPVPAAAQKLIDAAIQQSMPFQADTSAAMQLQGSEAPLSTQTRQLPGSLESVWAARQATLPILAQSASAPHAPAALPEQAAGPGTSMPLSDQQALLRALLKSLSKHRRMGTTGMQIEAPQQAASAPALPLRPKAIRTGISPETSAFRPVERTAAAVTAPALDSLSFLAHCASQQQGSAGATEQQQQQQQQQPAPGLGQGMLSVSQVLAQQALSFSAGDSSVKERHPELWRIFLGGHTGQIGQPQLGQPGHPNQAQPTLPDFGQPLESNYKSLSSPNPSTLLFRGGSLLSNPFASLSSVPLRGKLPDLASLQKKPSRRRTVLPDLTEGGGDSDTVSVLSQHRSLKPEPEVTGPQEASRGQPDPAHSEASKVRKALAGALDFSGSSKPGLPTRLQSFSQEFAPKGPLAHQEIARAARSALLAGQPSSAGNLLLQHMQSDVSAASYQVLDTILSQAHREGGHIITTDLEKLLAQAPAPLATPLPETSPLPKVTPVATARLQPPYLPTQATLQVSSGTAPPMSPSADTGGNHGGTSLDRHERRKANNRESARRTRAKKSNKMAELEEENSRLRAQLQAAEQQAEELKLLLQSLPQIGQHQRQLMEENENLKLEVQGLRSLMQGINAAANAAASQPLGAFQAPAQDQGQISHA